MKKEEVKLGYEFKKFIVKMMKLGFLSWVILLILWATKIINFTGSQFLVYTAGVMGIGTYKKLKNKK